ncbi:MAG: UvrB/UvrC motif-containing protein [Clostridia bacterium]|nr:UvrB/UvrC motif-containing protein [Clostridia bacterium]
MICQRCEKKPATFFYEENINGKKKSWVLCAECAAELKKKGELSTYAVDWEPFSFFEDENQLFSSLFGQAGGALPRSKRCPLCGLRFADIRETGKVGCAACYETFGEELAGTLYSIHGTARHRGRRPARLGAQPEGPNEPSEAKPADETAAAKTAKVKKAKAADEAADEIERMRAELKAAVEAEDFERAAELRDKIRAAEASGGRADAATGQEKENKRAAKPDKPTDEREG